MLGNSGMTADSQLGRIRELILSACHAGQHRQVIWSRCMRKRMPRRGSPRSKILRFAGNIGAVDVDVDVHGASGLGMVQCYLLRGNGWEVLLVKITKPDPVGPKNGS